MSILKSIVTQNQTYATILIIWQNINTPYEMQLTFSPLYM